MGLIKAGIGALGGTLADQWKEFFYCDSLDKDVLMVKGQKRTTRRSSNNGDDTMSAAGTVSKAATVRCWMAKASVSTLNLRMALRSRCMGRIRSRRIIRKCTAPCGI